VHSAGAIVFAIAPQYSQDSGAKILTYSVLIVSPNPMEVTRLSSEGQIFIPQALRVAHHWEAGQELVAIDVGDGILLKPKKPFPETTLAQVAGCLRDREAPKSLDELEDAIRQSVLNSSMNCQIRTGEKSVYES
jgi:bifunctional DNA-binding transcriptional regulator/antitoxin component of YhaV-PrlF toxin-antitoxin module